MMNINQDVKTYFKYTIVESPIFDRKGNKIGIEYNHVLQNNKRMNCSIHCICKIYINGVDILNDNEWRQKLYDKREQFPQRLQFQYTLVKYFPHSVMLHPTEIPDLLYELQKNYDDVEIRTSKSVVIVDQIGYQYWNWEIDKKTEDEDFFI